MNSEYQVIIEGFILFLCLVSSGFFSAAETAITSITKLRLKRMMDDFGPRAVPLEGLVRRWDDVLIALLICNNVVNIGAASLATVMVVHITGNDTMLEHMAALSTGLMTLVILIFGEIIPKTMAKKHAEEFSVAISPLLIILTKILFPLIHFFKFISILVMRMFGSKIEDTQHILTEREIVAIVDAGEREGVLEEEERDMIRGIIEFGDTSVHEVMVPRVDMVTIADDSAIIDALDAFSSGEKTAFSRLPVTKGNIDNVIGVLFAKDVMRYMRDPYAEQIKVRDIARKPFFVSENSKLDDVFQELRRERLHMAIAVDEYGGTAGLVTIEDLIEEIVGDILDEHDDDSMLIRKITDHIFILDAKCNIADLNEEFSFNLPEQEHYDSLGGFLTYLNEGVPSKGDTIRYEHLSFQILDADEKRVSKVKMEIHDHVDLSYLDEMEESED